MPERIYKVRLIIRFKLKKARTINQSALKVLNLKFSIYQLLAEFVRVEIGVKARNFIVPCF